MMEGENYYVSNLETGKLNVFTTKAYYAALPVEQKKVFTSFCLWSNKQQCWVSKGKTDNCNYLRRQLDALEFTDKGSTGTTLSYEEQVAREQQQAAQKAERSETLAAKAGQRSGELYQRAKDMASVIPFGQPILVGHHSEKRDRNYRDKIHNTFGKAFAEQDKADYYSNMAAAENVTAQGKKFTDPAYLGKRIKECEKDIRLFERRLKGKFYTYSPEKEISEQSRVFYTEKLRQAQDKLDFYHKCMKDLGVESGNTNLKQPSAKKNKGRSI